MFDVFLAVLACTFPKSTPKLVLLFFGHTGVIFAIMLLQLSLPTLNVNVKPCCNQVWWFISMLYARDLSVQNQALCQPRLVEHLYRAFNSIVAAPATTNLGGFPLKTRAVLFFNNYWKLNFHFLGYLQGVICKSPMLTFLDLPLRIPLSTTLQGVENFTISKLHSWFGSQVEEYCLLMYMRSLTLNLSGDLVMEWSVSDYLLMEIFFPANAWAYLMGSKLVRPFHLLGIELQVKVVFWVEPEGLYRK